MMTAVDNSIAWLAPSRTLARSLHTTGGAMMMRKGTGKARTQPVTRIGLRPIGEPGGDEVDDGLGDPEAHDERGDGGLRGETELLLAEKREHRPLEPHHPAHEGVEQNEQGEL